MAKSVVEQLCTGALRAHRSSSLHRATSQQRWLSQTAASRATPLPITATGPPPSPPQPAPSHYGTKVDQMRRKAAVMQEAKDIRAQQQGKANSPLRKRFWKDVHVKEAENGYHIHLDTRPVRTPTKQILVVPKSKPHLAHAIAIEWDILTSAQQALKGHNIPITSIVSRAQDLAEAETRGDMQIRQEILRTMMRYLDTDTLLCWAPSTSQSALDMQKDPEDTETSRSLRDIQKETSEQIISYLNTTVWPGVDIKPVLEEGSIMPTPQSEVTKSIISGWISGLPAFELAGLERAVLATKSLLVGTRLLIEWSEEFRDVQRQTQTRFGVEEAALASTIEVRWQTGVWGEVEDTHDVENEDLRRQLGSAFLVVSGLR
ncbi:ATP synthase mitochondrial F1 complex assembly factor 2 [Lithohypha guttulata]|uniref:ATP synthase mitochondrial F1 complex assembly factor 2 n=1 Tax=Lithohypha guttulata TaxID=1690604 RepID=A0AAN7PJT9_9EURO|nr:ATP synthase mitochondrial F1 complex assembly factor 2 [Lithohypha guttulata]KAK5080377.1 ATP synthase mitochondrial F1 complex assembly factor 2 [Lithohypha guttulata]KAK5096419.1 ATP synthase mitochondrial F1 complex assembly factor 2 [Lithohypha guttulata]